MSLLQIYINIAISTIKIPLVLFKKFSTDARPIFDQERGLEIQSQLFFLFLKGIYFVECYNTKPIFFVTAK